jgi:uncharacterized cupin superfamily protein
MPMSLTMPRKALLTAAACALALPLAAFADEHPAYIPKADVHGAIFKRPEAKKVKDGDGTAVDITTFASKDGKFTTGMYQAGAEHEEYKDGYEVNEYIYLIKGNIKLTSTDGAVIMVGPGEAATIPKGWKGRWDTDGYTKLWVIYDPAAKK